MPHQDMPRDHWEDRGPYTVKTDWVQVMPLYLEGMLPAAGDSDRLQVALGEPHQAAVPSPTRQKQQSKENCRSAEEVRNLEGGLAIAVEGGTVEPEMQL